MYEIIIAFETLFKFHELSSLFLVLQQQRNTLEIIVWLIKWCSFTVDIFIDAESDGDRIYIIYAGKGEA